MENERKAETPAEPVKLCLKERIMLVAVEANIDKTGKNTYSNYDYFRGDVLLITVKPLLLRHRIFMQFNPSKEWDDGRTTYVLALEDFDSSDVRFYEMTVPPITLKGTNGVQDKGAQRTYVLRYCLMAALGVANNEDDPDNPKFNDKDKDKPEDPPAPKKPKKDAPPKQEVSAEKQPDTPAEPKAETPAETSPAAPEEMKEPLPNEVHVCEVCGKEIIPTSTNSVAEVIKIGQEKHGKQLCAKCIRILNKQKADAVAEAKVVAAGGGKKQEA